MAIDMTDRRGFLIGCIAAGVMPSATWADVGQPAFLSAGKRGNDFVLCGLSARGDITFEIPLPARGHAAAAHPTRPEAVAFARRPGNFAVVLDCVTGAVKATITAATGRHFYGHGVFSRDGRHLFTTENDFDAARGVIGIWDAQNGYARIGEFDSGGIGPHDIKRLAHSDTLVVANGGIETHPESGRAKLNIPFMQSNLTYIDDGSITEVIELGRSHQLASIRHLSVSQTGTVAFGMQWEGGTPAPQLVGLHTRGTDPVLLDIDKGDLAAMNAYVASIAFDQAGNTVGVTCPRGGLVQFYDAAHNRLRATHPSQDIGGIAAGQSDFIISSGTGAILSTGATSITRQAQHSVLWDNHLVAL